MNEQESIEKTITQWTELAETGGYKPYSEGVIHNCHLCQYAYEVGVREWPERCHTCPYYLKYGECTTKGFPYQQWRDKPEEKRTHAKAFLAQIYTLRTKDMSKESIEEIKNIRRYVDDTTAEFESRMAFALKRVIIVEAQLTEAEPLEEFDVLNKGVEKIEANQWFSLKKGSCDRWDINCKNLSFPLEKLQEIHHKLGQVIAAKLVEAQT